MPLKIISAGSLVLVLDHHLMRSTDGLDWLDSLSAELGKQLYCAADFMHQQRLLL